MLMLAFLFWGQLHADLPTTSLFANGSCEVLQDGELRFVSGVPGCTEKKRSANGKTVTYQQTTSEYDPKAGKFAAKTKTFTATLDKVAGKTATVTYSDGEDMGKAPVVTTATIQQDGGKARLLQASVKQKRDGKEERLLVFDQELCAKFDRGGDIKQNFKELKGCASVLTRYQKVADEFNNKLKASNTSLGVFNYTGKTKFRPLTTNSMTDLMGMAWYCAVQTHTSAELDAGDTSKTSDPDSPSATE